MLIDLAKELAGYRFHNVVQVGAHFGQEHETFEKLGCQQFIYIEPQKHAFNRLLEKFFRNDKVSLVNCAVGRHAGRMTMNCETANQGMSSSLLKPALHLKQYPGIIFEHTEEVFVQPLSAILLGEVKPSLQRTPDLLTIDVQGYELEVLRSFFDNDVPYLRDPFAFILAEVNRAPVYDGCPMVGEIDAYLENHGYARIMTSWDGGTWGDALYMHVGGYCRIPFFQRLR